MLDDDAVGRSQLRRTSRAASQACEQSAGRRRVDDRARRLRLLICGAILVGAICTAKAGQQRTDNANETLAFDIPAQPLANALQTFGAKAGIQVLYESTSAEGRISGPVQGNFTPDAALEAMLKGSGLRVSHSGPTAITLAVQSPAGDVPPSHALDGHADLSLGTLRVHGSSNDIDVSRLQHFSASVQADIQAALRRNVKTRNGSYRLVLDIWVDSSRTIQRTELSQSTGDHERDALVQETLHGLVISQPAPPNTPQPVHVAIVVRALQ